MVLIAGGGPAGMMLAYQLARAGITVRVLEKHADFLRDFRGDTVHPSTMEVLHELGLIDAFLARPHSRLSEGRAQIGGDAVTITEAVDVVVEDRTVRGLRANTPRGSALYRADLVIAADGRSSVLRKAAGLGCLSPLIAVTITSALS